MEDMERRVRREFGYRAESDLWLPAFTVDCAKAHAAAANVSPLRTQACANVRSDVVFRRIPKMLALPKRPRLCSACALARKNLQPRAHQQDNRERDFDDDEPAEQEAHRLAEEDLPEGGGPGDVPPGVAGGERDQCLAKI